MASSECSDQRRERACRAVDLCGEADRCYPGELMAGNLYVGAAAPVSTVFDVSSSGGAFDLTTIASARLVVRFANGTEQAWAASVGPIPPDVAATATRARLTRVHDVDDIPVGAEGSARVRADITLTGVAEPIRTRWRAVEILRDGV